MLLVISSHFELSFATETGEGAFPSFIFLLSKTNHKSENTFAPWLLSPELSHHILAPIYQGRRSQSYS